MSAFNDILNQKAVALSYNESNNAAPIIVASGMGHLAMKIVEVAKERGIAVYEDNSLATILTQLDLGTPIPEELYAAIVDIYVYFLNFKPKALREAEEAAKAEESLRLNTKIGDTDFRIGEEQDKISDENIDIN